jgi:predicted metal-dependent hydrolase
MRKIRASRRGTLDHISLGGRQIEFRLVPSPTARKLRVRVGISGVEVVQPQGRCREDVSAFLLTNGAWIVDQLQRVERLRGIRRPKQRSAGRILFRGESIIVQVHEDPERSGANRIVHESDSISILRTSTSVTAPAKTLENWLRKQARSAIELQLDAVTARLKRQPGKVLIMGQRTKWGNCSALQNLSFNWRLIMAPEAVLRYLVTHEAVHLAVPDHSQKFWLTVRSLCPETERAKQWLCANGHRLLVDLNDVCGQFGD